LPRLATQSLAFFFIYEHIFATLPNQDAAGNDEAARILHRLQLFCCSVAGQGRRVEKVRPRKLRLGPSLRIELDPSDNRYKENRL
jgi:hypothetical protein